MISATWKKIFADVWGNKARSILVVLSIAVGVFAVGLIVATMIIVRHDMLADFNAINPHTARLYCQDFDNSLLDKLRGLPEVESVGASYNIWVKIVANSGKQHRINLNSITGIDALEVDRLTLEDGSETLADGEIYLERQGAAGLGYEIGDTVNLTLEDGKPYTLKLAGTVHDVQSNPFKVNGATSGFVTPATMAELGGSDQNNFVNLVTTGSHTDAAVVRKMADRIAEVVAENNILVLNVNVNKPGQPPAQSTVDAVMALMSALSILVVFLSTFLVTNTISALMSQQVRQIGVMKALGGTMFQIIAIYLGLVLSFGLLSLLIAVPLGALTSFGMTRWLIDMLNANPSPFAYPLEAVPVQVFIGLVVPVLGALIPVIGGARRTIRQAITSYGLEANGKAGLLDRLLEALPWLPRPLILSLRNTFRRKARLVLTLATLTLGGAIFIAMLGVQESMYAETEQTFTYFQSDLNAFFVHEQPINKLEAAVSGIDGVVIAEAWTALNANVVRPDGETTDLIAIYIPPGRTQLLDPVMIDGRWIRDGETDTIVVSNHFLKLRPEVKVGDTIELRFQETDTPFRVVGIFRMTGTFPAPFTYITPAGLDAIGGDSTQGLLIWLGIVLVLSALASLLPARSAIRLTVRDVLAYE